MALNPRQKAFVLAYLKIGNATKAYQEIYGGTLSNAKTGGPRLMAKKSIRAFLSQQEAHISAAVRAEVQYSRAQSFKYLCQIQKSAFDVAPKPDFSALLKAEELKGKMTGLYDKGEVSAGQIPPVEVIVRAEQQEGCHEAVSAD